MISWSKYSLSFDETKAATRCKNKTTSLQISVQDVTDNTKDKGVWSSHWIARPLNKQCVKGTFPRVMNVKCENTQTWWKDGYSKNIFLLWTWKQWSKSVKEISVIRECLFTGQITTVWLSNQDFGLGYFPFQWTQKAMEPISLILTYLGFISKAYVSD